MAGSRDLTGSSAAFHYFVHSHIRSFRSRRAANKSFRAPLGLGGVSRDKWALLVLISGDQGVGVPPHLTCTYIGALSPEFKLGRAFSRCDNNTIKEGISKEFVYVRRTIRGVICKILDFLVV
jgi:hypothetical protein